jgi:hypothetical protein
MSRKSSRSEEMLELLANDLLRLDKICEDEELDLFDKLEEDSMGISHTR